MLIGNADNDDASSMVNSHVTIQKRLDPSKDWDFEAHCAKKVRKMHDITYVIIYCTANIVITSNCAWKDNLSTYLYLTW